jgi:MFS family permease
VQGVTAALPAVEAELGLSASELGLFTAAYMLPAVLFALPLGYIADAFGRRRVFVAMAILYSVAGGAQAWVSDFGLMLLLRFFQGVAFGALMPLSVTLIGDAYRGVAQLRAQGFRQVAMAIGEFVLPLIGAALAAVSSRTALGAQGALLLLAPLGALILDDRRAPSVSAGYMRELVDAVRQPGLPAVLTAGFVRFLCKFALIAYLPFMLVDARGATLTQAAFVLGLGSGVAAVVNLIVVRVGLPDGGVAAADGVGAARRHIAGHVRLGAELGAGGAGGDPVRARRRRADGAAERAGDRGRARGGAGRRRGGERDVPQRREAGRPAGDGRADPGRLGARLVRPHRPGDLGHRPAAATGAPARCAAPPGGAGVGRGRRTCMIVSNIPGG